VTSAAIRQWPPRRRSKTRGWRRPPARVAAATLFARASNLRNGAPLRASRTSRSSRVDGPVPGHPTARMGNTSTARSGAWGPARRRSGAPAKEPESPSRAAPPSPMLQRSTIRILRRCSLCSHSPQWTVGSPSQSHPERIVLQRVPSMPERRRRQQRQHERRHHPVRTPESRKRNTSPARRSRRWVHTLPFELAAYLIQSLRSAPRLCAAPAMATTPPAHASRHERAALLATRHRHALAS
jgi:hypothetical protein